MPSFSKRSRANLETCHPDLVRLFDAVVLHFGCTIVQGHRGEDEQNEAFRTGMSQLRYPQSKHNHTVTFNGLDGVAQSLAVDAAPYPIDWEDLDRFNVFASYVMGTAHLLGIELRWGGDWDGDWDLDDQTFHDLPHFELV